MIMDWWLELKQVTHSIVVPLLYATWNAFDINQRNSGHMMTLSHLQYVES